MGQNTDEQAGADGHYQISTHDVLKLGEGDLVRGAAVIRSTLMAILPRRTELPLRRLDEFFQDAPSTATNSGLVEIPVTPEMIEAGHSAMGRRDVPSQWDYLGPAVYRAMAALAPPPRSPRPECVTDWVPAELYASVVAERDDARAQVHGLAIERGMILAQLEAKDARIAELKSELALRPAALVDSTPDPAKPSPFREFRGDPRRMGPL